MNGVRQYPLVFSPSVFILS